MAIIRKSHFPVYRDLGELLENFLQSETRDTSTVETSAWSPAVDITEEEDRFLVIADLPGINKENIQISLEEHILTLKGERKFEKANSQGYSRIERAQGNFYRRFNLPQTADDAKITAKYTQGVLEIIIPKKEEPALRKINIEIAD